MQCSIAPHKMLTGSPLMVIYKKLFRRYATFRGRMAFKTKYPNCRHNFARIRPVASFRGLGGKYIFIGKGFHFCHMFETHFLNTTKFWEPHKRLGDNCPACPPCLGAGTEPQASRINPIVSYQNIITEKANMRPVKACPPR